MTTIRVVENMSGKELSYVIIQFSRGLKSMTHLTEPIYTLKIQSTGVMTELFFGKKSKMYF